MSFNEFTGNMPKFIEFNFLEILSFRNNQMDGPISEDFFSNVPNLKVLSLESNNFSGVLPSTFPSSLEELLLVDNDFSGTISADVCQQVQFISTDCQSKVECDNNCCDCCSIDCIDSNSEIPSLRPSSSPTVPSQLSTIPSTQPSIFPSTLPSSTPSKN